MTKQNNLLRNIWVVLAIYGGIFALWWLFKGTVQTLYIITGSYIWLMCVGYILFRVLTRKEERQQEIKKKKQELLDKTTSEQIMDKDLIDKMIVPVKLTLLAKHNIQPEEADKSPTYFYKRLFEDKHDGMCYLQFINRKDADSEIVSKVDAFSKIDIEYHLKNASESSREYVPKVTNIIDPITQAIVKTETQYTRQKAIRPLPTAEEVVAD